MSSLSVFSSGLHASTTSRSRDSLLRAALEGGLGGAAFAAVWLCVILVESVVALMVKGGVAAIEFVCAVLDWVGAEY
jgi:hypothetical protein